MITILQGEGGRLPLCSEFVVSQKARDLPGLSFETGWEKAHDRAAASAAVKGTNERRDALAASGDRKALAFRRTAGGRNRATDDAPR